MSVKRGLSPVQRTLHECRKLGRFVDKCEKWNQFGGARRPDGSAIGIRQDLFGFIDIIALDADAIVAVQACAGSGHAEHKRKIVECEFALAWLQAGGRIELWSWRKVKLVRGGKAERWQPRVENITKETLDERHGNDNTPDQAPRMAAEEGLVVQRLRERIRQAPRRLAVQMHRLQRPQSADD